MRPIAAAAGLTPIQLACQWNLAHGAGRLRGADADPGGRHAGARPIEDKRAELAALPTQRLGDEQLDEIREIGDNRGSMTLKGASPEHEGDERPDRWPLSPELVEAGRRWDVDPDRDLRRAVTA